VRPDLANLIHIFASVTGRSPRAIAEEHKASDKVAFKAALVQALIERLCPIGNEIERLLNDTTHIKSVLKRGEEAAKEVASKNLASIRQIMGFL